MRIMQKLFVLLAVFACSLAFAAAAFGDTSATECAGILTVRPAF